MKRMLLILVVLASVPVAAQDRPIAGSTVQTTDTTANSLLIGCAVGSTTCTGGIKAGALVIGGGTSITSSSNIALLAAANTYTVGPQTLNISASNNIWRFQVSAATKAIVGLSGAVEGDSTTDLALFAESTFAIRFYTNGSSTEKFQIDSTGNWLKGASIMDSTGTPTCAAQCTSVTGNDYAFVIALDGGGADTSSTINFGRTWTNTPICVASNLNAGPGPITGITPSTTTLQVSYASFSGGTVFVLCRGY